MRYILWSGGWDSTYMLCKAARESDESIQPVVLSYSWNHGNATSERSARKELLTIIRGKDGIKAEIREPIEISADALPSTEEYEAAYENKVRQGVEALYGEHNLFYLFGKASILFPGIYLGIEAPAPGKRENNLGRFPTLLKENGITVNQDGTLDLTNADEDFKTVFGNVRLPIVYITEIQMISDAKEWGYFDDVFQKTWSCQSSMEVPCGVCRACETKWDSGDAFLWRFGEQGIKNHEIKQYLKTVDEEKGTNYAEYFTKYITNGKWITVGMIEENPGISTMANEVNTESSEYKEVQQKSENLMEYFSYLDKNWPEAQSINAPTI